MMSQMTLNEMSGMKMNLTLNYWMNCHRQAAHSLFSSHGKAYCGRKPKTEGFRYLPTLAFGFGFGEQIATNLQAHENKMLQVVGSEAQPVACQSAQGMREQQAQVRN